MLTEKNFEKAITKCFNVENTIYSLGTIKKHSNVCWEYVKNNEDIISCNTIFSQCLMLLNNGKMTEKSLPFSKSIMGYNFNKLVICKNKDTGVNLLKRYGADEHSIDIEMVKIDGEDYYLIY